MNSPLQTIILSYPISMVILFSLCSLLVGSVLSMMIYRIPIMLELQPHRTGDTLIEHLARFNLWVPRSHCQHCKKTVPAYHNLPLISYILLRGQCAFCHRRISWQYPIIEALTLGLSLFALYHFGYHLILLAVLPFIWFIICLGFIDLNHQLLPDSLTLSLLWLGLLINSQAMFCPLSCAGWSAAGAYISLWLFIQLFYLITGKIGMGNGDFKLFAAFGAWFGWMALSKILLIACILGSVIGIAYLRITHQNRNTAIPFGPYLCIAGLIQLFS